MTYVQAAYGAAALIFAAYTFVLGRRLKAVEKSIEELTHKSGPTS